MQNHSFHLDRQKHLLLVLFFFTLTFLMLSVYPYFFLDFKQKVFPEMHLAIPSQNLDFSVQDQKVRSIYFPKLQKLKIYYVLNRPDQNQEKIYFAYLDRNYRQISFPQKIYLEEIDSSYRFSENKSELSLFLREKEGIVETEQRFDIDQIGPAHRNFDLKTNFSLPIEPLQSSDLLSVEPFKYLADAQFLGKDALSSYLGLCMYLFKIDDQVVLIKQGDLLVFDGGKWQLCDKLEDIFLKSAARISNLNESLEIDCFDDKGSKWAKKSYVAKPPAIIKNPIAEMIQDIRLRSRSKVSLFIEKQKLFLSEGAWAVKKDGKWTVVEPDQVLQEVKAEKFFYVKQIRDNEILAYLIDKTRTLSQELNLALSKGSFSMTNLKKTLKLRGVQ